MRPPGDGLGHTEVMQGTLGSLDSLKGVPLHLALEYTGVGLVACDGSGMLTLISPMLQELFGTTYEPVAEPFYVEKFRLFREDGETPLATDEVPLMRARRGEFVRDTLVTHRRPDGSLVHLRCNAVPLRDDEDRDIGAIALVQDVTAETQAALRAEALQKRLVETINHEFRTPLAALLGHVELIHDHRDRREDLDPELAGWLDAIERSGWRLRDLVREVAELVNSDEPEQPVDRRPRRLRAG
jgi:PAS domain S-box-containing protein